MKVLLVEDNERVAQFVRKGLAEERHTVDHADNGRDGLFLAATGQYDVIILDRMLPGEIDGLGIVEALRRTDNRTPILILSALAEVDDRIRGLRAGGDDYLTKPFALGGALRPDRSAGPPLAGRRHTDCARGRRFADEPSVTQGDARGKADRASSRGNSSCFEFLMRHADQVVTRTMLLENVWEHHFDPQTNVIDVHVSRLRQKIDEGFDCPLVHTVRGVGYRLAADA